MGESPLLEIWHNPRCSKSREGLSILEASGREFQVRRYLEAPPTTDEVLALAAAVGVPVSALVRRKEPEARAHAALADDDDAGWAAAIAATPKLLERPVVRGGARAVLGRPPERIREWLQGGD